MRVFPEGKRGWSRFLLLFCGMATLASISSCFMVSMPGSSFEGPLPPQSEQELLVARGMEAHVRMLAGTIGDRNMWTRQALQAASDYIEKHLHDSGLQVRREEFSCTAGKAWNLVAEIRGATKPEEIVLVGAHFDSVSPCPAADDNASGVAFLLELAGRFAKTPQTRTIRFVAFGNEEPPFFQREGMGSREHARLCRERGERVVAMLSLETMGYFSDAPGSQRYPFPFNWIYPDRGDFIAFIGCLSSRGLTRRCVRTFRENCSFPSEGSSPPSWIPGVGWSDHWSFWEEGYPAVMVTDTAPFRNPNYHQQSDLPDTLDYPRMSRVFSGLTRVVEDLASEKE